MDGWMDGWGKWVNGWMSEWMGVFLLRKGAHHHQAMEVEKNFRFQVGETTGPGGLHR